MSAQGPTGGEGHLWNYRHTSLCRSLIGSADSQCPLLGGDTTIQTNEGGDIHRDLLSC